MEALFVSSKPKIVDFVTLLLACKRKRKRLPFLKIRVANLGTRDLKRQERSLDRLSRTGRRYRVIIFNVDVRWLRSLQSAVLSTINRDAAIVALNVPCQMHKQSTEVGHIKMRCGNSRYPAKVRRKTRFLNRTPTRTVRPAAHHRNIDLHRIST